MTRTKLDSKIFLQLISTSRGELGGTNNVFKTNNFCFLTEKKDAIVPPLLSMNQDDISALKSERLPLC